MGGGGHGRWNVLGQVMGCACFIHVMGFTHPARLRNNYVLRNLAAEKGGSKWAGWRDVSQ